MDTQGVILSIAQQLTEELGAVRCTIRAPKGKNLRLEASFGEDFKNRILSIPIEGTIAGEAVKTGQTINIPNINLDSRYIAYLNQGGKKDDGPKSLLAIPLIFEERLLGVAQVYAEKPFTPKKIVLAEALSRSAAMAFYLEQFSKISNAALMKIAKVIIADYSFERIPFGVVDAIALALEAERCTIYRIFHRDGERNGLCCEISAGTPPKEHGIGLCESLSQHPDIGRVFREKIPITIDSPKNDPLTRHFWDMVSKKNINQILYVPILNQEVHGVIVLDATGEKEYFRPEEIDFCCQAANLIALIIDRDKFFHQGLNELRDDVLNRLTVLAGFTRRTSEYMKIITEGAQEIESLFSKYRKS
ncbi:MAG: GAF domain-containing protein [Candidatus Portnoybacteria bacterium]|nr:GAF domain-containing protein [Candidatus Portnoybacteria bacterium]